jgi:hypothetical protein
MEVETCQLISQCLLFPGAHYVDSVKCLCSEAVVEVSEVSCQNTGYHVGMAVDLNDLLEFVFLSMKKVKDEVHPCTGTEALYRLYGP